MFAGVLGLVKGITFVWKKKKKSQSQIKHKSQNKNQLETTTSDSGATTSCPGKATSEMSALPFTRWTLMDFYCSRRNVKVPLLDDNTTHHCNGRRILLCWVFLLTVGFGSCAFHCTLRRQLQWTDEIPMVLGNCIILFVLYGNGKMYNARSDELVITKQDTSRIRSKDAGVRVSGPGNSMNPQEWNADENRLFRCGTTIGVILMGILKLASYFVFGNFIVFSIAYGSGVVVLYCTTIWVTGCCYVSGCRMRRANSGIGENSFGTACGGMARWNFDGNRKICISLAYWSLLYYGTAFVVWAFENAACKRSGNREGIDVVFGTGFPRAEGPTVAELISGNDWGSWLQWFFRVAKLHCYWHYGAALGTYSYALNLAVYHLDWLGFECREARVVASVPRLIVLVAEEISMDGKTKSE